MKSFWRLVWSGFQSRNRWRFGGDGISPYHLITDRVPPNVPGAFWRFIKHLKMLLRVMFLLLVLCALVCFGAPFFVSTVGTTLLDRYSLSCLAVILVLQLCAAAFGLRILRGRFERLLIGHSWFVCIGCGYVLEGLPPHHRCPECGSPYDRAKLERTWKNWIERSIVYSANEQPLRRAQTHALSARDEREIDDSQEGRK